METMILDLLRRTRVFYGAVRRNAAELRRLLPQSGFRNLFAEGSALPSYDTHAALMSLPGLFHTTLDSIPATIPCSSADPGLVEHGPFMDTAALMVAVDLVITSDTSTAHLAGGLGVPVWLALPYSADWRWLRERSDSPWYPTMRLFRQRQRGDWEGVFRNMADELTQMR